MKEYNDLYVKLKILLDETIEKLDLTLTTGVPQSVGVIF